MKEFELKCGCNPNQKPARVFMQNGELPIEILNGKPGYINLQKEILHRNIKETIGLMAIMRQEIMQLYFQEVKPRRSVLRNQVRSISLMEI